VTASNTGMVPRPKRNLCITSAYFPWLTTAPSSAIYTSQQGNSPLSRPMKKTDL
jgi:hypothetical protein